MKFIGDERNLMNEIQSVLRKEDSILLKHLCEDDCTSENEKMLLQEMQRCGRKLDKILSYFLNSVIISEDKKERIIKQILSEEIVDYLLSGNGNETKKVISYEKDNGRAESDTSFTQILPVSTERTKVEKIFLESNSLEKLISRLLIEIGIPANIRGYTYSREALLLIVQYNIKIEVTKCVYPDVAKKCKVTSTSVERCIRHAIERAWESGNLEVQNEIFGYTVKAKRGKPTNSEFLFQIADYIRLNK